VEKKATVRWVVGDRTRVVEVVVVYLGMVTVGYRTRGSTYGGVWVWEEAHDMLNVFVRYNIGLYKDEQYAFAIS